MGFVAFEDGFLLLDVPEEDIGVLGGCDEDVFVEDSDSLDGVVVAVVHGLGFLLGFPNDDLRVVA